MEFHGRLIDDGDAFGGPFPGRWLAVLGYHGHQPSKKFIVVIFQVVLWDMDKD